MNSSSQVQDVAKRQCAYCGRFSPGYATRCANCREMLPEITAVHRPQTKKRTTIRQGLLYMLLAAVIHYFAGGYSGMELPLPVSSLVTLYLSPLLFFSGLGLMAYGFYVGSRA